MLFHFVGSEIFFIWGRERESGKMMSSGGYTTINDDNHASNNVVSGSVPAVSGPDHVTIKFAESNLQTFPPSSDSHGKISAVFRPPSDADDTFSKPVHRGSEEPQPTGWMHAFTVGAYKPYFDVDTSDVLERIKESFFPFRGTFTEKTSDNPDLYGPFWICTTLIFVAAAIGTFVTYVAHKLQKKEWNYDINLVTWSAGLFYGYVTLVPLGLYVILKYFSVPSGLVQLWCLYGYSLFVFIPASAMLASHCLWCRIAVTIGARLCHCQPSSTPPLSSSPKPVALHLDDPRPTYLLMLLNHKGICKSNPACNCCLCLCYFSSTTLPSSIP